MCAVNSSRGSSIRAMMMSKYSEKLKTTRRDYKSPGNSQMIRRKELRNYMQRWLFTEKAIHHQKKKKVEKNINQRNKATINDKKTNITGKTDPQESIYKMQKRHGDTYRETIRHGRYHISNISINLQFPCIPFSFLALLDSVSRGQGFLSIVRPSVRVAIIS